MPTPIGHALGGIAVGYAVEAWRAGRSVATDRSHIPWTGVGCSVLSLATIGVLADIDLLFGIHRGLTHSVTATILVGLAYGVIQKAGRLNAGFTAFFAYGSHILFDWCGADTGPPSGVMAFWPVSEDYYQASYVIFYRVCREYWDPACWQNNLMALGWELLVLVPVTAVAVLAHRRFISG
jgi:membrane-bound metal-dependent hydrolase YbcI (DUF457 family)